VNTTGGDITFKPCSVLHPRLMTSCLPTLQLSSCSLTNVFLLRPNQDLTVTTLALIPISRVSNLSVNASSKLTSEPVILNSSLP